MIKKEKYDLRGGIDMTGGILGVFKVIAYTVLGWFTITIEAFLRKDFGERYYSKVNFFVGFWLMLILAFIGVIVSAIISFLKPGSFNWGMGYLIIGYVAFSLFHFWKIWVNAQIGYAQHSLYSGTPHLLPVAQLLCRLLNPLLAAAAILLGRVSLNRWSYERLSTSLEIAPPIKDAEKFAKMWLEPAVVLILAINLSGMIFYWLLFAGAALIIYNQLSFAMERDQQLDIADNLINAAFRKEDMAAERAIRSRVSEVIKVVQERSASEPHYIESLREESPSVLEALQQLDINLGEESPSKPSA